MLVTKQDALNHGLSGSDLQAFCMLKPKLNVGPEGNALCQQDSVHGP